MDAPMSMACAFGRVDGYRYWMVDATLPTAIPVGSVTITSITGGIAYHMQNTKTQQQMIQSVSATTTSALRCQWIMCQVQAADYFSKRVLVSKHTKRRNDNGDVLFTIAFNSSGGLQNISFLGDAYMMCKRSERATSNNYAHGSVAIIMITRQKFSTRN